MIKEQKTQSIQKGHEDRREKQYQTLTHMLQRKLFSNWKNERYKFFVFIRKQQFTGGEKKSSKTSLNRIL